MKHPRLVFRVNQSARPHYHDLVEIEERPNSFSRQPRFVAKCGLKYITLSASLTSLLFAEFSKNPKCEQCFPPEPVLPYEGVGL